MALCCHLFLGLQHRRRLAHRRKPSRKQHQLGGLPSPASPSRQFQASQYRCQRRILRHHFTKATLLRLRCRANAGQSLFALSIRLWIAQHPNTGKFPGHLSYCSIGIRLTCEEATLEIRRSRQPSIIEAKELKGQSAISSRSAPARPSPFPQPSITLWHKSEVKPCLYP